MTLAAAAMPAPPSVTPAGRRVQARGGQHRTVREPFEPAGDNPPVAFFNADTQVELHLPESR